MGFPKLLRSQVHHQLTLSRGPPKPKQQHADACPRGRPPATLVAGPTVGFILPVGLGAGAGPWQHDPPAVGALGPELGLLPAPRQA